MVLALKVAARILRRCFLAYVVRTDQPLKHVSFRPDLEGRMTKWSIELSEFNITFDARKKLKEWTFIDYFLAEFTPPTSEPCSIWTVFTDGSSNTRKGGGGGSMEGLVVDL